MRANRRTFLKTAAALPAAASAQPTEAAPQASILWPRVFRGPALATIAMPLGGVAAGSISLGGRGQLRDWEIFNRPDKGNQPSYAFAAVRVEQAGRRPVVRVAESRIQPPFEGATGLGTANAPGLPRLQAAAFTSMYPMARIEFEDRRLPVRLALEAFTPIFPLDAEESGLPAALLRYVAFNPGPASARVSLCFSIENPFRTAASGGGAARPAEDERRNEPRRDELLAGLVMTNPGLDPKDPAAGEFVLAALDPAAVSLWRGWPRERWFNSPMLFWDAFKADGTLGNEPEKPGPVGAVSVTREIPPGAEARFEFVLAWRCPNRTPAHCGWRASKGNENAIIGNHYAVRFPDAWSAARHLAANLAALERRMRAFLDAMKSATMPGCIKDAAMSNLSTLATQVVFRTADGEFHGFEGANDRSGCCYGSCTHVWNYEAATSFLFPSLARSLRNAAFGHMMDERGAIHFREILPKGTGRFGLAAADGQMGQVMKVWLDYRLTGDRKWLAEIWPRVRKAVEFCWISGGWDADRDGVMEGAQHNTYDIEFYGPNPQCGIYYLGGLRAAAELARAAGDAEFAARCEELFRRGSAWIDENLFNGEYYIQKVRGLPRQAIAETLVSTMGSDDTEKPDYQLGEGCLADQLIGQYQADLCRLGPLLKRGNILAALRSIYRYNRRPSLAGHESVQRIYALNDEAALLICDYAKAPRPRIPFPYFAEAWTGIEYPVAAQMIGMGMVEEGLALIEAVRRRHDGVKRNPFDEPECGHHYARALSAWSAVVLYCGFFANVAKRSVEIEPAAAQRPFRGFWSAATGWGVFELGPPKAQGAPTPVRIEAVEGRLEIAALKVAGRAVPLPAPALVEPGRPLRV
ncbi:MAG: non-lysosomal glucosylceramidase [Bryobacteraceae bacterium]|nr:non-lysosomal glucosylceramidase [Bryobacteraceae bacterium]